jgi:hypothetical protein
MFISCAIYALYGLLLSFKVDSMLGSYMEDIGMTPEQFENACSKNTAGGLNIRFHQVEH